MSYRLWEEEGKKSIVRAALKKIATQSAESACNLLIQFRTDFPGVSLPTAVREKYPEDMVISLNDSFWNLYVEEDFFAVDLLFESEKKNIKIPFNALMLFNDVDANFNVEFDWENAPVPVQGDNILLFEDIQRNFAAG